MRAVAQRSETACTTGPQPTIWSNVQTPDFSEKSRLTLTGKRGKNQIVALLSAFSSLFEKGFSVEFSQMDHQFTFSQLPIYPFQRLSNYPLRSQLPTPFWAFVTTKSSSRSYSEVGCMFARVRSHCFKSCARGR